MGSTSSPLPPRDSIGNNKRTTKTILETDQGVKTLLASTGRRTPEAFLLPVVEFVADVMVNAISVVQTVRLDTHSVCRRDTKYQTHSSELHVENRQWNTSSVFISMTVYFILTDTE